MELPPQPPPDTPAPPPGADALRSRSIMWQIWGGGTALVLVLALAFPLVTKKRGPDVHTYALKRIKQVGLSLYDFDIQFGRFPDASTIPAVKSSTVTPLTLGTYSSNAHFRQLIAAGLRSEKIFWAKTADTPRKPDDIFTSDSTALAPGECSFSYIAGLSSSDDPDTPVVVCPLIPGTTRFDPKPFDGKAIILRIDSSARAEAIDKSSRVMIHGMDIFDPLQPFWKGKTPDIKWPE